MLITAIESDIESKLNCCISIYNCKIFQYILFNFTHRQNSRSRENINAPEDEVPGGSEADGGGGVTSQGTIFKLTQK